MQLKLSEVFTFYAFRNHVGLAYFLAFNISTIINMANFQLFMLYCSTYVNIKTDFAKIIQKVQVRLYCQILFNVNLFTIWAPHFSEQ